MTVRAPSANAEPGAFPHPAPARRLGTWKESDMSTRKPRYRVKFFNSDAGQDRGCPPFRFAGPFDGVQLTYDTMRETAKGDTIADYHEDLGGWKFDGDTFTDATIEAEDPAAPDLRDMLAAVCDYFENGEMTIVSRSIDESAFLDAIRSLLAKTEDAREAPAAPDMNAELAAVLRAYASLRKRWQDDDEFGTVEFLDALGDLQPQIVAALAKLEGGAK